MADNSGITEACLEVLRDLADGHTSKEIAQRRHWAPSTVAQRIHRANQYLGTRTATQAVLEAYRRGLLHPTTPTQEASRG